MFYFKHYTNFQPDCCAPDASYSGATPPATIGARAPTERDGPDADPKRSFAPVPTFKSSTEKRLQRALRPFHQQHQQSSTSRRLFRLLLQRHQLNQQPLLQRQQLRPPGLQQQLQHQRRRRRRQWNRLPSSQLKPLLQSNPRPKPPD